MPVCANCKNNRINKIKLYNIYYGHGNSLNTQIGQTHFVSHKFKVSPVPESVFLCNSCLNKDVLIQRITGVSLIGLMLLSIYLGYSKFTNSNNVFMSMIYFMGGILIIPSVLSTVLSSGAYFKSRILITEKKTINIVKRSLAGKGYTRFFSESDYLELGSNIEPFKPSSSTISLSKDTHHLIELIIYYGGNEINYTDGSYNYAIEAANRLAFIGDMQTVSKLQDTHLLLLKHSALFQTALGKALRWQVTSAIEKAITEIGKREKISAG